MGLMNIGGPSRDNIARSISSKFAPPPVRDSLTNKLSEIFHKFANKIPQVFMWLDQRDFEQNPGIIIPIMFKLLNNELTDKSALSDEDVSIIGSATFVLSRMGMDGSRDAHPPTREFKAMIDSLDLPLSPPLTKEILTPLLDSLMRAPIIDAMISSMVFAHLNPLPLAEAYDNAKYYKKDDKILWTDGKVYKFKEYVGAAGFHPDNHPECWILVEPPSSVAPSSGAPPPTPQHSESREEKRARLLSSLPAYDRTKEYRIQDSVTFDGKVYTYISDLPGIRTPLPAGNPNFWSVFGGYRRKSRKNKRAKKSKRTHRR